MTRDEVRAALDYLGSVAVAMHFLRLVGADMQEEAEALGIPDTCERLVAAEPASREGWAALARVLRHLVTAMEDRGDATVILLRELHTSAMTCADRAAATVRQED